MRRISIVGSSGSGKTTLARTLAERLDVAHVELDAIFHQPGWTELDDQEFQDRTASALHAATDGWVVCGNYTIVQRSVIWPRADTVVVLDLERAVVMRRVVARTLRRVVRREVLWNGNREPWTNLYRWDPERNIIRWAWTRHAHVRQKYRDAAQDPTCAGLDFVFLRTPAEVERFVATLPGPRGPGS